MTPVSEIGPYRFKPGKLTETLMNAYADEVRGVKVPRSRIPGERGIRLRD